MSPRPMIFLSTRAPWPPVTGHFMRTYRTVAALAKERPVHFLGFFDKGLDADARARARSALEKVCASVWIGEVPAETSNWLLFRDLLVATVTLKPFVAVKYYSSDMRKRLKEQYQRTPDAIVWADMLPLAEYLKHLPSAQSILTMHNVESTRLARLAAGAANPLVRFGLGLQARLLAAYERRVMPMIDHCVAVSVADASELAKLAPRCRIAVVPNGAELSVDPVLWGTEPRPTAIWVGGMKDPYNKEAVDVFCKAALPEIIRRVPDFQWLVVGGSPADSVLAAKERFPQAVRVLGFVDNLEQQYHRAHIALIPLQSGAGTKLKVLEAMGMGLAVVTTPVGAEGLDAVHDTHMSISVGIQKLVDETCRLLGDRRAAMRIAQAAHRLVEQRFQWPLIETAFRAEAEMIDLQGIDT